MSKKELKRELTTLLKRALEEMKLTTKLSKKAHEAFLSQFADDIFDYLERQFS
jgi:hypothetical protein